MTQRVDVTRCPDPGFEPDACAYQHALQGRPEIESECKIWF